LGGFSTPRGWRLAGLSRWRAGWLGAGSISILPSFRQYPALVLPEFYRGSAGSSIYQVHDKWLTGLWPVAGSLGVMANRTATTIKMPCDVPRQIPAIGVSLLPGAILTG